MSPRSLPLLLACAPACLPDADASSSPHPAVKALPPASPDVVLAVATEPEPEPAPPPPAPAFLELRESHAKRTILSRPEPGAPARGLTGEDTPFRVLEKVDGPGCKDGWGRLEAGGYLCLTGTVVTTDAAFRLPAMVTFDPPEPTEFDQYMETGEYDHSQPEQLTPAVYAKRWRRFHGQLYKSIDSFVAGDPPVGALIPGTGMKYRFEAIVDTAKGPVLTRNDGEVARLDDVYLYPITRWQGRELASDPTPEGLWPALTVNYDGAMVRTEPRLDADVITTHPFHTSLLVDRTPASEDGHWWRVPDAGGPGIDGYLDDLHDLRHPVPSPSRPPGVRDDELWVDVELSQQVLQLWRGDTLVYWTVVATGAPPKITPTGTYRILGKFAYKDMSSREGADDVYHVEDVPWTLIFRPSYALHAAYWHWGFGHVASHGCVNLAVKDARYLFEHLGIALPDGWEAIYPTPEESAVVRIRRRDDVGTDRREEFASL